MSKLLLQKINKFLKNHLDLSLPIVLAYSGGADSTALLHLLKKSMIRIPLKLHVAHIDHSWRDTSHKEALLIKKQIEDLSLPFHGYRLQNTACKEHIARKERYAILQKLACELNAQAVLLAHHQDDQVETVLKRIFEGASLYHCTGMQKISLFGEMVLWRPLLDVTKNDLLTFLKQEGAAYIEDVTNLSPLYLRGRCRTTLFPLLEEAFGKSIRNNLYRLGERAKALDDYLQKSTHLLCEMIEEESTIRLSLLTQLDELVLEYFLKKWMGRCQIHISADHLRVLVHLIKTNRSHAKIQTKSCCIIIGKGRLALKKLDRYLENKER